MFSAHLAVMFTEDFDAIENLISDGLVGLLTFFVGNHLGNQMTCATITGHDG